MSEPRMVCNGHKDNIIERCTVNELYSAFGKSNTESTNTTGKILNKPDSMTIGTIPFPDFDHLYASNFEENGETNMMNINIARSNLNACHLNIIEEQAKIIDSQNQEILKLKKQNESLIARIEQMNRRLNLNQCSRKNSRRMKYSCRNSTNDDDRQLELSEDLSDDIFQDNKKFKQNLDDSFPDDVPLIQLAPVYKIKSGLSNEEKVFDKVRSSTTNSEINDDSQNTNSSDVQTPDTSAKKSKNYRIKFRRSEIAFRKRRNKMVRFVEDKKSNFLQTTEKYQKRNCAQTVDDKLITDDAVLFLKATDNQPSQKLIENNVDIEESQRATVIKKKKLLKIPILTTTEPHYTIKRDLYYPVTYKPSSLEVPSFRTIEKDNNETPDVPVDYYEDVRTDAAKERHLRFEVAERKRKKWDVQRIRELRQNERLKEKLRKRKSRWNKLDSPKQSKTAAPEQITTLFPDIKSIEKIIITDAVPVTALGSSIPKVPSWNTEFRTEWTNDGSVRPELYEDNHATATHHHK